MSNRLTLAVLCLLPTSAPAQEETATPGSATSAEQNAGILPVPEYAGSLADRPKLTGAWGGVRQQWAEDGISLELDWYQSFMGVVDGGREETSEYSTNLDYRLNLDLARMGAVPGALVTVRAQSRFGDTVNGSTGLLLPVDTYSAFPISGDPGGDVGFAVTELNWLQFLSEEFGLLAGKVTTLGSNNEFMGGAGRTQFMNFQFVFPASVAQLAPYSTLALGAIWLSSPTWTVNSTLMNTTDASTTTGFDDIGEGTTWATYVSYKAGLGSQPGGGTFGVFYAFDGNFSEIGGLNLDPSGGVSISNTSSAWALTWSGWQYLFSEGDPATVDPTNGRQDLQGLGVFVDLGLADEDTNPTTWSVAAGLSGRGSIPGRDRDTWGVGGFYNDLQDLGAGVVTLDDSTSGMEVYYDFALLESVSLTLDAQWTQSALPGVDNATVLGARLNMSF